ncbi:CHAT domain-containing protein [Actinomadura sp. LOL_011]|uniref:CHAT domain-containing protein n=1 Tax=Actinomadura sp. LOL_011 TaxID=3345410 RepID=UPI003A7FAA44
MNGYTPHRDGPPEGAAPAGARTEKELLRLVATDPATVHARALALVRDGTGAAAVPALRAAGLAAKELGRLAEGLGLLGRALEIAEAAPDGAYAAAQVRMSLVGLLSAGGDIAGALAHASHAEGVLRGTDAARLAANTACALARAGRLTEAQDAAARALPVLRRGHDPAVLNGLLTNLGLARAFQSEFVAAEAALTEAVEVARAAGLRHQTAMSTGNLAFVVSRRGDVPRALRLYAEAEPSLSGERLAQCRFDQAETLISAGLPGEARPVLEKALASAAEHGYRCDTADGLLLLSHAELDDDDPERAVHTAERARAAFAEQERTGWMLLAEHVLLRARWAAGERSPVLLRSAAATADRLARGGWTDAAAGARVIAARTALALGRPAGHLLGPVGRPAGSATARITAWHAAALERAGRGDRRGAVAAVQAGLRVAEEHADALGALDLRARAAGSAAEPAELGLGLARSARELLAVEERRRAIARPVRVRPPADPERAAALAELRARSGRRTAAIARGVPPPRPADLAALEAAVRARTRRRSPAAAPSGRTPGVTEVAAALGGRALVELVGIGGELHAVTVADGRPRRHRLGPAGAARHDVRVVRYAAHRLAAGDDPDAARALAGAAGRLDRFLLDPLRDAVGDRELVIAPAGPLHGLPWAALPSLAGRPVTVVPSARAWLRARTSAESRADGHVLLVAGPGLEHAGREVAALRRLHPDARILQGPGARAEVVRDALDGASLAHLAAHGEFREGNALFSRLRLADGPLLVHDLDELAAPPHLVVLSACDIGRGDEGDAVLGMAGVLLALGTATVIASVTPVRDAHAPAFMSAFHTGLAAGLPPSHALAAAPRTPGVLGLLCMGGG